MFSSVITSCASAPPVQPSVSVAGIGAWQPIDGTGGPKAGLLQSAVAGDGVVLLWGGSGRCSRGGSACGDGARFDTALGRFVPITSVDAPSARYLHTAVWGNGKMLVWGGVGCGAASCSDGAAYDPVVDRWTALPIKGAPAARGWHTAIFTDTGTGDEMIVWGGEDPAAKTLYADGGRYDLRRSAWQTMARTGAPTARRYHSAIWTGTEMVIWGGDRSATNDDGLGDGAAYNPAGDRWRTLSRARAPAARWAHTAVWTGKYMIVWGGLGCGRDGANKPVQCGTGAAYDPVADAWRPLSSEGAPTPRWGHSAVWTGSQMIVWGGTAVSCGDGSAGACSDGAAYDPATDRWAAISLVSTPAARTGHAAAWSGGTMFIWGGAAGGTTNVYRDGALYTLSERSGTLTETSRTAR